MAIFRKTGVEKIKDVKRNSKGRVINGWVYAAETFFGGFMEKDERPFGSIDGPYSGDFEKRVRDWACDTGHWMRGWSGIRIASKAIIEYAEKHAQGAPYKILEFKNPEGKKSWKGYTTYRSEHNAVIVLFEDFHFAVISLWSYELPSFLKKRMEKASTNKVEMVRADQLKEGDKVIYNFAGLAQKPNRQEVEVVFAKQNSPRGMWIKFKRADGSEIQVTTTTYDKMELVKGASK